MGRLHTSLVILVGLLSLSSIGLPVAGRSDETTAALDPAVEIALDYFDRRHTGLSRAELQDLAHLLVAEARKAALPTRMILAVIDVESSGYNFAVSRAGALGLMQLLPGTGEEVAAELGIPWRGPETLFDPEANVRMGVHYLATLVDRFGEVGAALAAYNWGPSRISTELRKGKAPPVRYRDRVVESYETSPSASRS